MFVIEVSFFAVNRLEETAERVANTMVVMLTAVYFIGQANADSPKVNNHILFLMQPFKSTMPSSSR